MSQPANYAIGKIRKRILIPIVSALAILFAINVFTEERLHSSIRHDNTLKNTQGIEQGFHFLLQESSDSLSGLIRIIDKNPALQSAWLAKDKKQLIKVTQPIYESINRHFNITHFYFHGMDGLNFLRMHNPEYSGDRINRTTLKIAMREKHMGIGMEIGTHGNVVLRVVHPWRINGKIQGYIEFGREIEEITKELGKISKSTLLIMINKKHLPRNQIELSKTNTFDFSQYSEYVLGNITKSKQSNLISDTALSTLEDPQQVLHLKQDNKYCLANALPLMDINNNMVGLLVVLKDITGEMRSERLLIFSKFIAGVIAGVILFIAFYIYIGTIQNELDQTHQSLINEVDIHRQTEAELVKKSREITARNQELESYSHSIAHDLRAPLRSIVGFSQIVMEDNEGKLDEETIRHLKRIVDSGKHMSLIIDDILELSRISRCEIQPEVFNISDVATGIFAKKKVAGNYKNASYEIQPDIQVKADPRLIHILLTQLIDNSLKYSQNTSAPLVEFGLTEFNNKAVLYIQDNGTGFDMQYSDKIFSAFQRLHGEDFKGTGIGLATVVRILARHGQKIWVESEEGKGTRFYFTLELA